MALQQQELDEERGGDAAEPPVTPEPQAFLADAVRIAEAGDAEAAIALYADDAVFDIITDGAHQRFEGIDEVAAAQRALMGLFLDRGARFSKSLVAAGTTVIVNTWSGQVARRAEARGVEIWQFNEQGKLAHHRLYGFLNVKASTNPLAQIRVALSYPATAVSMMRNLHRQGLGRTPLQR